MAALPPMGVLAVEDVLGSRLGGAYVGGFLAFLMRDVRVAQEGIEPPVRYSGDSETVVSGLSRRLTPRETEGIMSLLSDCSRDIYSNVRPDLSLTKMFAYIAEVLK